MSDKWNQHRPSLLYSSVGIRSHHFTDLLIAAVLRKPVKYILTQLCPFRWFLLDLKSTSFHSKTSIYVGITTHCDDSPQTISTCYFSWSGGGSERFLRRGTMMRWADCNHIQLWPLPLSDNCHNDFLFTNILKTPLVICWFYCHFW